VGIRSFLAFELPPQIRQVLLRVHDELKRSSLDVRWVRPEGIHLTVVFMGDVREADISPIIEKIGEVCLPLWAVLHGFARHGVLPEQPKSQGSLAGR
jgi:2'-5' RNA ligase